LCSARTVATAFSNSQPTVNWTLPRPGGGVNARTAASACSSRRCSARAWVSAKDSERIT
jgi:hypothetical protein